MTRQLPDLAPDAFRDRAALVQRLADEVAPRGGRKVVALTDEFQLKGLVPFFATFIDALGFDVSVTLGADRRALKRGIEEGDVPFCAPMQQYHGVVSAMAERQPDCLFLPMLREIPRVGAERASSVCPVVQGAPDLLRAALGATAATILSPGIDMGTGFLDAKPFLASCRTLAASLGVVGDRRWRAAYRQARARQERFERELLEIGERALAFCNAHHVTPVVVVGRSYTIHNDVLNSNVPAILREQGVIPVPLDCLPVPHDAPSFPDVFWGYSQRILRAAWHIRRTAGLYGVFCSNYSCGPDSFTLHSFTYLMEGRPFVVVETDGHAGDAGTRTRIEAFLHCVREDQRQNRVSPMRAPERLTIQSERISDIVRRGERLLVPAMGPEAEAAAAAVRGLGVAAEVLPAPSAAALALGRRHTSGKECLPMTMTLGSLLARLEQACGSDERFALLMPGSNGPCRFGAYRTLQRIVLERLGYEGRVRIWSPPFGDYFGDLPAGFSAIVFLGVAAYGALAEALHDVRPVETCAGAADAIYAHYARALSLRIETAARGDLSAAQAIIEATTGRGYGIPGIVAEAARALAAVKGQRALPSVLLVGEIYVRSEPAANGEIARALEQRGLRVRLEPVAEIVEYSDHVSRLHGDKRGIFHRVERALRTRLHSLCHDAAAEVLGWPARPTIEEALAAAAPYARDALEVESVLTLGVPIRAHAIDATVSVGPLECMPNKIAEALFCHVAEREGLLSLTLALNGEPVDGEVLDSFAFAVHARAKKRQAVAARPPLRLEAQGELVPEAA